MADATLSPYDPTLRERLAQFLMGDSRDGGLRGRLVQGVTGTRGLPGTEGGLGGAADLFPPTAAVFSGQEAEREKNEGNIPGMLASILGVIPGGKAAGGAAKQGAGFFLAHRPKGSGANQIQVPDYAVRGRNRNTYPSPEIAAHDPFQSHDEAIELIRSLSKEQGDQDYVIVPAEKLQEYLSATGTRGRLDEFLAGSPKGDAPELSEVNPKTLKLGNKTKTIPLTDPAGEPRAPFTTRESESFDDNDLEALQDEVQQLPGDLVRQAGELLESLDYNFGRWRKELEKRGWVKPRSGASYQSALDKQRGSTEDPAVRFLRGIEESTSAPKRPGVPLNPEIKNSLQDTLNKLNAGGPDEWDRAYARRANDENAANEREWRNSANAEEIRANEQLRREEGLDPATGREPRPSSYKSALDKQQALKDLPRASERELRNLINNAGRMGDADAKEVAEAARRELERRGSPVDGPRPGAPRPPTNRRPR